MSEPTPAVVTESRPRLPRRRVLLAAATVATLGAGCLGTWAWRRNAAPQVNLFTIEGHPVALAGLPGQVSVVNFWSTGCAACLNDMPELALTYRTFAPNAFQLVAVAMQSDAPSYVLDYASTRALPFPVALDLEGLAAARFGNVEDTPTTFVIDKHQRIIKRYDGTPDFVALRALIREQLLA